MTATATQPATATGLIDRAPDEAGDLLIWLRGLNDARFDKVWVSAIVQASSWIAPEGELGPFGRLLTEVRDRYRAREVAA